MKARTHWLTLGTALALTSGTAFAQESGTAALDTYFDHLQKLGLQVKNGDVRYDAGSDTLTLTDSTVSLSGTVEDAPDGLAKNGAKPAYDLSMSSSQIKISGLSFDDGVFKAESWVYSDDTQINLTAQREGKGHLKIDVRLSGLSATDYSFSLPDLPAADPTKPVTRWLPFLRASLLTSFEEIRVDSTGFTFEVVESKDDQERAVLSGTIQMDGYLMSDSVDGRIASMSVDNITQTFQGSVPEDNPPNITARQGKTVYKDFNFAAYLDMLDPDVPETGEPQTFIGSLSAEDFSFTQTLEQGVGVEFTADRASMDSFTLTKREGSLLAIYDDLMSPSDLAPEKMITSVFQLYRSYGLADARLGGIKVKIPTPELEQDTEVTIEEIAMTGVNSNGIEEMMLAGLIAPKLPDGASLKLDKAAIGGIQFADYEPMRAMISTLMADPNFGEDHPFDVARAFLPLSFSYEVKGLEAVAPDRQKAKIGAAEMTVSTTVSPIPTSVFMRSEGLQVPVSSVEDPEMEALFRALGLENVVWSDETRLHWDENTLELHLEKFMAEIEGLGRAEISARFANVPKALFEDPEGQGQMALIVAQFVEASATFRDAGLASKGIAHFAETQGIPENVFREALVAQAAQATAPVQNEAFTKMVSDAASKFLESPGELKITLTPSAAVPLAQILGSLAAPQSLPDLLAVKIEAN
ncbi:hypothetical protein [Roseibium sp.]|uniref:hypothetical protein n=1 Tax=Roseibium sp. TaxID=1936156 RepID=UPI003BAF1771